MLVQDTLTGYFHEVPDGQLYEPEYAEYPELGEVVYDGFGNPVGLPFLAPIAAALAPMAAKALPAIASSIIPAATRALPGIVRGVTGAVQNIIPSAAQAITGAVRTMAPAVAAGMQAGLAPRLPMPMAPFPFRPPMPLGWIRPQLPYTGLGPRRLYMRCAVWPGPRGLVPAHAAQVPAGAVAPVAAAAATAAQQAAALSARRRRRFRRR